jgi:hypothetical protein
LTSKSLCLHGARGKIFSKSVETRLLVFTLFRAVHHAEESVNSNHGGKGKMAMRIGYKVLGLGALGLALLGPFSSSKADTILSYDNVLTDQFTATNPAAGGTHLSTNEAVTGTYHPLGNAGGSVPFSGTLIVMADSIGDATNVGGTISQAFSGSFSIKSGTTNILSGTFTDALFGSGTGLTFSASSASPGESLTFTSDVISVLGPPTAFSISLSDVNPAVHIVTVGGHPTIAAFTATDTGTMSANVPEPSSMAIAGLGALGLIGYGIRRRRGA